MENHIDLIIPRGSSELVRNIQEQSLHIPVLGHAEGVCHVYIDRDADLKKALRIARDAKCDYPAGRTCFQGFFFFCDYLTCFFFLIFSFHLPRIACNAMETLLIHEDLMSGDIFNDVCNMLKREGVKIYAGPRLNQQLTFGPPAAKSLRHEYGALECCIEIVPSLDEAINHIHTYGSGHTDVIVTENGTKIEN